MLGRVEDRLEAAWKHGFRTGSAPGVRSATSGPRLRLFSGPSPGGNAVTSPSPRKGSTERSSSSEGYPRGISVESVSGRPPPTTGPAAALDALREAPDPEDVVAPAESSAA